MPETDTTTAAAAPPTAATLLTEAEVLEFERETADSGDPFYIGETMYGKRDRVLFSLREAIRLQGEVERLRGRSREEARGYARELNDAENVLGGVLGYPWYKDDQKNFPGATEATGVCIGDHTAASIAAEAAGEIRRLRARLALAEKVVKTARQVVEEGQNVSWKRHVSLRERLLMDALSDYDRAVTGNAAAAVEEGREEEGGG